MSRHHWFGLLPLIVLTGCTAGRAGYVIIDTQRAYQAALDEGALEIAPYQTQLAYEFLQKAKEEDGYSDYGAVEQLCRTSKAASAKAEKEAGEGGVKVHTDEAALPESTKTIDTTTAPSPQDEGDDP